MVSLTVLPLGSTPAVWLSRDLLLFAYVLGTMRFVTMTAALDTGSSFEGMGASREAWFSMLAEPALLLGWQHWRSTPAAFRSAACWMGSPLRKWADRAPPAAAGRRRFHDRPADRECAHPGGRSTPTLNSP
jgi:hypothetical protein